MREALRALACQAESHRPRHLSGARCSWVELRLLEPRCVRSQRSSDRASPLRDRVPGHPASRLDQQQLRARFCIDIIYMYVPKYVRLG